MRWPNANDRAGLPRIAKDADVSLVRKPRSPVVHVGVEVHNGIAQTLCGVGASVLAEIDHQQVSCFRCLHLMNPGNDPVGLF